MLALLLLSCFGTNHPVAQDIAPPAIGARVADLTLPGVDGQQHALSSYKDKKAIVVVFVGTECPIANLYLPTLVEMHKKYSAKGVQFLLIYSNAQDSFADVVTHAREHKVSFPALKDSGHKAADAFGAERTPQSFLLDSERGIRYRGRIDNQYGYTYRRPAPTQTDLIDAIEAVLAGKPVANPVTEVRGCLIGRDKP
jgi:peroxiredoxin